LLDKLFWVATRRFWSGWQQSFIAVTPETVVRWHRAGFRLYWSWLSRRRVRRGRNQISKELRELIFQMVAESPTWGAPRIHGERQMLGFQISERTVSRWMPRAPRNPEPARRWKIFLRNHRDAIAAMDFFTVPTVTFGVLYVFSSIFGKSTSPFAAHLLCMSQLVGGCLSTLTSSQVCRVFPRVLVCRAKFQFPINRRYPVEV
jgi:hypothetical protein